MTTKTPDHDELRLFYATKDDVPDARTVVADVNALLDELAQAQAELEFLRAKRWEAEADAGKAGRELDELRSAARDYFEMRDKQGGRIFSRKIETDRRLRSLVGVEDTTENPDA